MDPKETILYVPIGFVGNDRQAADFNSIEVPSLLDARQRIADRNYPLRLGLKTTLIQESRHGWGVTLEGQRDFDSGITQLSDGDVDYFVENWPSGPTRSMCGVLGDSGARSAGFKAVCTSDLDQFPPQQNLENFILLYERVRTDSSVLGTGARSVPVVLSYNQENAHLRRIFEGIMNLTAVRSGRTNGISGGEIVDPAYKVHGDAFSGVYLLNLTHDSSATFMNQLVHAARQHGFFGFEDEYYMVLEAAIHGGISGNVFRSVPNPFDEIDPQEERKTIIRKQIKAPLEKLAQAIDVRVRIEDTIRKEAKSGSLLSGFYSIGQIEEVCTFMREALESPEE